MTRAAQLSLSFAGLALVAGGAMLWLNYADAVYFDSLAAAFIGCFI